MTCNWLALGGKMEEGKVTKLRPVKSRTRTIHGMHIDIADSKSWLKNFRSWQDGEKARESVEIFVSIDGLEKRLTLAEFFQAIFDKDFKKDGTNGEPQT